jgi:periplasmic protein TonB
VADAFTSPRRTILIPAVFLSIAAHGFLIAVLRDLEPSAVRRHLAIAMSLKQPPPQVPPPKPEAKTLTPIAIDPPERRIRPKPKAERPAVAEPPKEEPKTEDAPPGAKVEGEAPSDPARRATPGPKDDPHGTGPAAGDGAMLGAAAGEGPAVRTDPTRSTAPDGRGTGAGAGGKAKSDLQDYHRSIFSAVNAAKRYPPAARHLGLEGRVVLAVRIDRGGRIVGRPRIVESTKHEILDEDAIRVVEAVAPFPPLPRTFDKPEAEFMLSLKYHLSD